MKDNMTTKKVLACYTISDELTELSLKLQQVKFLLGEIRQQHFDFEVGWDNEGIVFSYAEGKMLLDIALDVVGDAENRLGKLERCAETVADLRADRRVDDDAQL